MPRYRDTPSRTDRAAAIVAVVAIHLGLGALILSSGGPPPSPEAEERTVLLDIIEPPPPEPPPAPRQKPAAEKEQGAAGARTEPAPVVAPPPTIVLPASNPIAAARVAGTGNANRSGAALSGSGTGAGGSGSGPGGGGSGGGAGRSIGREARLLSGGLTGSDYRRLPSFEVPSGRARLALTIGPDGRVTDCRTADSSGSPTIDLALCQLLQSRTRWAPARDMAGNPISVRLFYVATWQRG